MSTTGRAVGAGTEPLGTASPDDAFVLSATIRVPPTATAGAAQIVASAAYLSAPVAVEVQVVVVAPPVVAPRYAG